MRSAPKRSLALIGDSILDNWPYTAPEPSTAMHLERLLGEEWEIRVVARDGSRIADVHDQLRALDGRPDLAVLSVGGNDAVPHIGLLNRPASNSSEVLDELVAIGDEFARRYEEAARAVADRAERTILCTIYEVRLEPAYYARLARAPLAVLNDRIIRTAASLGLEVLDLRHVCTDPSDFVLHIEPSPTGATKIARAIARLARLDPAVPHARLHVPDRAPEGE